MTRLLLLAGTEEAASLAREATLRFGARLDLVSSLAGGTERPAPRAGVVRIGGFGGAAGLARYLADERIDLVIDASQPFATSRSAEATEACASAGVARLQLVPPSCPRHPLDCWIEVDAIEEAARTVRRVGRRAFLSIGAAALAGFSEIHEVHFLVRLGAAPPAKLPLRFYELVLGQGPFSLAEERHLLERHAIDVVVAHATGSATPAPKLVAAREASLPVVMIRRPPPQPGETAATIAEALDWLAARV